MHESVYQSVFCCQQAGKSELLKKDRAASAYLTSRNKANANTHTHTHSDTQTETLSFRGHGPPLYLTES